MSLPASSIDSGGSKEFANEISLKLLNLEGKNAKVYRLPLSVSNEWVEDDMTVRMY